MCAESTIGFAEGRHFTFQKGSLGMEPTINGRAVIKKYLVLLRAALQ